MAAGETATYRYNYKELAPRLTVKATVTALTPLGEKSERAEGIWDTGATNTVISKRLADRMGIVPMPRPDDMQPMTMVDARYIGKATVKLKIGDIVIPFFPVKVSDIDPQGKFEEMGYEVPDFFIGMDVIASGQFEVDSTSGETILTFVF